MVEFGYQGLDPNLNEFNVSKSNHKANPNINKPNFDRRSKGVFVIEYTGSHAIAVKNES